jgi:hypothetical protein
MSGYCERCGGSKSIGFSDAEPHGRPCPDCNGGEELDPFRRGIAAERARIVAWLREQHTVSDFVQSLGIIDGLADCVERGEHEGK